MQKRDGCNCTSGCGRILHQYAESHVTCANNSSPYRSQCIACLRVHSCRQGEEVIDSMMDIHTQLPLWITQAKQRPGDLPPLHAHCEYPLHMTSSPVSTTKKNGTAEAGVFCSSCLDMVFLCLTMDFGFQGSILSCNFSIFGHLECGMYKCRD